MAFSLTKEEIIRRASTPGFDKTYRENQIIVVFTEKPNAENIYSAKEFLIASMRKPTILTPADITAKTCDQCDCPLVLFEGIDIETVIVTEGVKAGSGTSPGKAVGELSLNYYISLPYEHWPPQQGFKNKFSESADEGKKKVVVAVLDTGLDAGLVDPRYLWEKDGSLPGAHCYEFIQNGWNFVDKSELIDGQDPSNYHDDHIGKHGSLVSQFIINEFIELKKNYVRIMPLKTHSSSGKGDLYGVICAIHVAMAHGVNIINASWGFANILGLSLTYLDELISKRLAEKGILFITASGNFPRGDEKIQIDIQGIDTSNKSGILQLRNVEYNNFWPASLSSKSKIVITTTTTDGVKISPAQNFSEQFVDLGVGAHHEMQFDVPFSENSDEYAPLRGSSFATAIATGIIGANCSVKWFKKDISKDNIFKEFARRNPIFFKSPILIYNKKLAHYWIRNGCIINKRKKVISRATS
ncbi:S8 family serine peptidase [Dyadobacter sp. NIV53]|uniref:S8 family serine peptidase n=1 Tax=Dyadobacter sp. NIV53 TaxID=2861765 RepID=UPI001C874707|nr:S8 family serine peptidase [Dyadobacter sp. NIV53]